ncbi:MAG: hydrogenase nickel incorporation protein HypB [Chitinivibrionales bacterium]|nr:hydrogenase nickel incorporation protein HypB [Chitinivibrionales bacterium]
MCDACGCSDISQAHNHDHAHTHSHDHHQRQIELGTDVLKKNNELAAQNRAFFDRKGLFVLNLISSPGAGKTSVIESLAAHFGDTLAVIEGDLQTRRDAERVIRAGSRAYQIETHGACHLDAHSIAHAAEHLDFDGCRILCIENVGNLVCPAGYELGEHEKAAILSIPEGDDKILKYPALFHRITMLLINKIDLAPHIEFDTQKAINECKSLNRAFTTFPVSAKTGEGMDKFFDYLSQKAEQRGKHE